MLTLIQIAKAVNDTILTALSGTDLSSVPVVASDVSEPIVRPSIKVMLEGTSSGLFNAQCREKSLTYRIYFFAKDANKYRVDNLKMQEILEGAFLDGLWLDGAHIPIASVDSELVDTVLICSVELYAVELLPDTGNSEPIEEIIYKEVHNG